MMRIDSVNSNFSRLKSVSKNNESISKITSTLTSQDDDTEYDWEKENYLWREY